MHHTTGPARDGYRMGARALLLAQQENTEQIALHEDQIAAVICAIGPHAESCGTCTRALRNDGLAIGCGFGRPLLKRLRHHERLLDYQERRAATDLSGRQSLFGA